MLKEKNSFESIRTGKFVEVITSIFGKNYVNDNWEYIKPELVNNGWIKIFSGLVEKDEVYMFVQITEEGEWLITNGVPGEWCNSSIEAALKNLKIKD